jgi:AraC family transcriptional regulator
MKAIELDYRKAKAADPHLPQPSVLSSRGWSHLHLEVFQQPKFEIAEHRHTMHVIAHSPISAQFPPSSTGYGVHTSLKACFIKGSCHVPIHQSPWEG